MIKLYAAFLLPLCAFAQADLIANYTIQARLDPSNKTLQGHQVLEWKNPSTAPVGELQFHLYMNAFRNEKSTFMKGSGGQLRGDRARKDNWGSIDLEYLRIANGADLTTAVQFIAPDDNNADDRTVIRVPLPSPVPPGATVKVEFKFRTKFPHVFARTGYHGDFFLGGQWFPKVCVYEPAGMRYAATDQWNCHQFHPNSEFYANFGRYDVSLTMPSNFVVGATGVMQEQRRNGDNTTTYRFVQSNVHDFAWTAQPTFRRHERMFRAAEWVKNEELDAAARLHGISRDEARLSDVRMIVLLQPDHEAQADRHFRAVANGIKYFGLWYGRYPHATITVVDPPPGGEGAGGMEYPTLITAGTEWLQGINDGIPELVTVHEFGHQFWQGLVANNEFEEAWMDEGFNTYSTGKVMDVAYGAINLPLHVFGIPLSRLFTMPTLLAANEDRAGYLALARADNLNRRAWEYQTGGSYSVNSYSRTGLVLRTLERLLGEDTMARVMRAYHQRWRYKHPAAPDFFRTVNEVSGRDMTWFFDQFINGSNTLDYSVDQASSRPARTRTGDFDGKAVTVEQARKIDADLAKAKKQLFETTVVVRREGEAAAPVDIRFEFEKGVSERRQWDGQYRWSKFTFTRPEKLRSVMVDPDRKLLLDTNFTNNGRTLDVSRNRTPVKWTASFLFWFQWLLALAGSVA